MRQNLLTCGVSGGHKRGYVSYTFNEDSLEKNQHFVFIGKLFLDVYVGKVMLRLFFVTLLFIHFSCALAANGALPLKEVLGDEVNLEQKPHFALVEYHPDTSTIRLVLNGHKTLPVLHDFAYLSLLGADESIVLSREKRDAANAHLPAVLARWDRGCRETNQPGRIHCAIGKIAAKHRIQRYFISHEQGSQCIVRESLDGKNEISKPQCTRE